MATVTDVNNAITKYYYNGTGGCNNLLLTSTIFTVDTLSTSETWNCVGGVLTSSTGADGQVTQYGYVNQSGIADPLWRRDSTSDPLLNVTWNTYTAPTSTTPATVETYLNFPISSPTSTVDTLNTLDGLGRLLMSQKRTAPGATTFDQKVQDTYGWNCTWPCLTQTIPGGTALTTTQLDALGRTVSVTDGGKGTVSYQYVQNDVLQSVGPTLIFQKQLEYDGLGRLTSVCEITSASGSGSCGQSNPATGLLTKYSYNALGDLLTVAQNAQPGAIGGLQSRTYVYDGLSRLTSETNPESGTVTNYYDSYSGSVCGNTNPSFPGDLVLTVFANGNSICYLYDALGRPIDGQAPALSGYPTGTKGYCFRFSYDNVSNGVLPQPSGPGFVNLGGRLVEAETDNCAWPPTSATTITDEWFSYNADGRNTDVYESTPNSGGYYHTTAGYWANGSVNTLTGVPGQSGWTFGADGEGRPNSATYNATPPLDWVTSTTYYPSTPTTTVTFGDGDTDVYSFDATTGRMNQFQFTIHGSTTQSLTGTPGWNPNGTLGTLGITDQLKSSNTQTCSYAYDALARINSVDCVNGSTTVWSQNFTLDPFGNISKSGSSSFAASYLLANGTTDNQEQTVGSCVPTYDASGNLTRDCSFATPETYTWSGYGNPATLNGVGLTYDALGREVEIASSSTYTQVLYGPIGKLGLMNGRSFEAIRVPLPGGSTGQLLNGQNTILHTDWLGSSRLSTLYTDQTVANDVSYAPYGEAYNGSTTDLDFTGQYQDTLSGLYDFLNREYSPVQGRWISPDPSGVAAVDPTNPQSWNRFAYVLNNPLSNVDPSGQECVWDDGSFDSAADPDTGNGGSCAAAGGTWVDPDLFENAMLTNGQWNSNFGDWSGNANANLAQNWVVSSGGVAAEAIDPNSTLSSLSSDLSYGLSFARSFFGGFTVNFGSGSCLGVAAGGFTPVLKVAKKIQDYSKNYVAPIVASLPGAGASLANRLYSTVQYGADRGNALEISGAISATATFLATQGKAAVSAVANAPAVLAKSPPILLAAGDILGAVGVYQEGKAALSGDCH